MKLGPITFKIPEDIALTISMKQRTSQPKFKILMIGLIICSVISWVSAYYNDWQLGFIILSSVLTIAIFAIPQGMKDAIRKVLKNWPGVSTPQTWVFSDLGIVVSNADGQIITSPWSKVKKITKDENYIYLHDDRGGQSPIPLHALGESGFSTLIALQSTSCT